MHYQWKRMTVLLFIVLPQIAFAAPSKDITIKLPKTFLQPSVLPEGARVVAGDPKKNEFFILSANEDFPGPSAHPLKPTIIKPKSTANKIVLVKKSVHVNHAKSKKIARTKHPDVVKIKIALNAVLNQAVIDAKRKQMIASSKPINKQPKKKIALTLKSTSKNKSTMKTKYVIYHIKKLHYPAKTHLAMQNK